MSKIKWVKIITRENSLLDRSLRTLAYHQSLREIGKANISQCPIVGRGRITSWYYSPADYRHQQKIIFSEFKGKNIDHMAWQIVKFLEQGYLWAKSQAKRKIGKSEFLEYLKLSQYHHAHGRGAIVYGYWGEPAVTAKLRKVLQGKVTPERIDFILSLLSAPVIVTGTLSKLYHHSEKNEAKRQALIKSLKLNGQEKELVRILSWFTFFYELGEVVSSYLYDQLLNYLKEIVSKKQMAELEWYDPYSLEDFFWGKKLSIKELRRRKESYVLKIDKGRLTVLSGRVARLYEKKNFDEELPITHSGIKEIKGTTACLGKVIGKAKIVITQADQQKMKQGDILVSTMTTPRLMTAVKKAAAIVTDEGGMTAHAAIVSRELKIPCVVGTKIATQVLKDGDLVEVDATKGIINMIKK